jgi:hypothetical protein
LTVYRTQDEIFDTIQTQLEGVEMGTNDLYLIKKLKESGVTLERMTSYFKKVKHAGKDMPTSQKINSEEQAY